MNETTAQGNSRSVYEVLKSEIAMATLEPGAALKQDHLAARFGVSHVPVREALSRLVAEGLATSRQNKGTSVSSLTVKAATEIVELRWLLEGRLIELAVPNLSRADIGRASDLLDQLDQATALEDAVRLNHAFHTELYVKADRPHLLQSVETARLNLGRYLYLPWRSKDNVSRSEDEHRTLLKLCLAGDVESAKALIVEHVSGTGQQILAIIREEAVRSANG